jgi:hypothetical protein
MLVRSVPVDFDDVDDRADVLSKARFGGSASAWSMEYWSGYLAPRYFDQWLVSKSWFRTARTINQCFIMSRACAKESLSSITAP